MLGLNVIQNRGHPRFAGDRVQIEISETAVSFGGGGQRAIGRCDDAETNLEPRFGV